MKNFLRYAACGLASGCAMIASADTAGFIDVGAIEVTKILPPPPVEGSVAALADLEAVLRVQASRTPEQVAWAKRVERDSVYYHATIVGDWFAAENVPATGDQGIG